MSRCNLCGKPIDCQPLRLEDGRATEFHPSCYEQAFREGQGPWKNCPGCAYPNDQTAGACVHCGRELEDPTPPAAVVALLPCPAPKDIVYKLLVQVEHPAALAHCTCQNCQELNGKALAVAVAAAVERVLNTNLLGIFPHKPKVTATREP